MQKLSISHIGLNLSYKIVQHIAFIMNDVVVGSVERGVVLFGVSKSN